MRKMYCFVCAREAEYSAMGMQCPGRHQFQMLLQPATSNAIINACDRARRPATAPLAPAIGDDWRCPNCTQPLSETTWDARFLRCVSCRFELPMVTHVEALREAEKEHAPFDNPDFFNDRT